LENRGVEFGVRDRIRADDEKGAKIACGCGIEHLRQRIAGRRGEVGVFGESARRSNRDVAGEQVGEEAHVGSAARV